MQYLPTRLVQAASALSLAAFVLAPGAFAQSFEQDEWRFAASNPAPERPLHYTHVLEGDPNDSDDLAELVDNIYPTHLEGDVLTCLSDPPFEVTSDFVDAVLSRFEHAAGWLDEQGFAPIHTYARVPEYRRSTRLLGDTLYLPQRETVNLVGCGRPTPWFAASRSGARGASNRIEFGHRAEGLRDANELAFRLTAINEFMHVYINNFAPAFNNTDHAPHWFNEAIPDAMAIRYVGDTVGGYSSIFAHDDVGVWRPESESLSHRYTKRFYLAREYFVPLNLTAAGQDEDSDIYDGASRSLIGAVTDRNYRGIGYNTNGFWIHVVERYLDDDPSLIHGLLQSLEQGDIDRLLQRTDEWLDQLHGPMAGIEHVFPQFLAEYEGWWENRVDYNGMSEARWLDYGFNGCEEIELDFVDSSEMHEIEIALNAGRCFDVILASPVAALRPGVDIAVFSENSPDVANHLYLALARVRNADTVNDISYPDGVHGQDWSCYELVEAGDMPRGGCLMDPEQGRIEWSTGRTVSARTFNVSKVGNFGFQNVRLRFILSYVDSANVEVGTDMAAQDVSIVVAPSYVELDEGSFGGAKSSSRSQTEPDNETDYTLVYGVHAGGLGRAAWRTRSESAGHGRARGSVEPSPPNGPALTRRGRRTF